MFLVSRPSLERVRITSLRFIWRDFISGTVRSRSSSVIQLGVWTIIFSKSRVHLYEIRPANHKAILKNVGIEPIDYTYYDPRTIGLDFAGLTSTLTSAPEGSTFLLHGCAHNPTGVDPTQEQWQEIATIMLSKKHFAFFDCAYQGFASGDLDGDAWAVRHFVERGVPMLVCQSFAKNAGLYGERVGCLHVVGVDTAAANRVKSQLSVLQRSEISNPPTYGARIVSVVDEFLPAITDICIRWL